MKANHNVYHCRQHKMKLYQNIKDIKMKANHNPLALSPSTYQLYQNIKDIKMKANHNRPIANRKNRLVVSEYQRYKNESN